MAQGAVRRINVNRILTWESLLVYRFLVALESHVLTSSPVIPASVIRVGIFAIPRPISLWRLRPHSLFKVSM